ncbi:TPA: hypothetical protein ACH3X1_012388 [Trebouxia sp. C0004]
MFVCGHPRHNAQGTNLNITQIMTSKRLPNVVNSLTGNVIVRGAHVHQVVKISNDSLGCLRYHIARIRELIKTNAMLVQKSRRVHGHCNARARLLSLLLPE